VKRVILIVRILGIVIILLIAAALALPFLIDANQFRPTLESRLSAALGREVKLGDLKVSVFSGGVSASDLSIADDPTFSKTPFLRAQSVNAAVELMPLIFSRKLNITAITINEPQISLVETPAGVFNFSSMGGRNTADVAQSSALPSQPADLAVALIKISDGRITLEKTGSRTKPLVLDKLNIEVKNFSEAMPFPFSLSAALAGGGTINLTGNAGPISAGAAASTPFNAKLTAAHVDLIGSGIIDPATGLAGLASVDGAAESAQGAIHVTGKLKADQLVLARGGKPAKREIEIDLDLAHDPARQSGEVREMTVHFGSAVAKLTGSYRLDTEPATVNLRLTGSKMPLTELATFLPALDIALPAGASIDQGTADVNLTSTGPLDKLVTEGTVDAENARLANYDFASKLQVLREFTAIKGQPHTLIQTMSAHLRESPGGTAVDSVRLIVASIGTITGSGTVSPAHALDFKMRAAPGSAALNGLTGSAAIPFTIQGTAENPVVRPDVAGIVNDRLQSLTGGKTDAGGILKGIFGGKKKQ
jgi:AsmA protein